MIVEKAGHADIGELINLRLEFLQDDYGFLNDCDIRTIRENLPEYFRAHMNKDLFVYVIREGQYIVSCAFLLVVLKPMSPAFINGRTGIVMNVYTCPSFRRKGYAKLIMEQMLADAWDMEISVIELKSTEAGYSLYRSAGFIDDKSKYRLMKWERKSSWM